MSDQADTSQAQQQAHSRKIQSNNSLKKLFRVTLAKRLGFGFGLLGLGVLSILFFSLVGLTQISTGLDAMVQKAVPVKNDLAEARIALLQISTAAAEHYNSQKPEQLTSIESDFSKNIGNFNDLITKLHSNELIEKSESSALAFLNDAAKKARAQFELIEWNMKTHRRSIVAQQRIEEVRRDLAELRGRIKQISNNYIDQIDHPPAQTLARQIEGLLESSALMAVNVSLANSLEVVQSLQKQLRDNLDSVKTMTFDILDQSDADLAFSDYYEEIEPLFEELNTLTTANDGLISQQKNLFVEIRSVLPGKIERVQNNLADAARSFSDLSKSVDQEVNGISRRAVDSVSLSRKVIFGVTAVIIFLSILVSWLVIRSVRKPIRRLSDYMRKVGEGDLSSQVGAYKDDEIGQVFASTETLVENFRDIVRRIAHLSKKVSDVSENTAEATEQARSTMNQQSHDLNSVATAINEMSASVREVATNTRSAADEMTQSEERAHEIEHLIQSSVSSSEQLDQSMNDANKVITGLDEEVSSIEQILEVIQGIAEQTNLLALNAAIEAARAGEQGRGFAVVADEVRTLASRTQQSTQEIRGIIDRVLSSSQNAVQSISHSQNNVTEVSQRVTNIQEIFEEYLKSVSRLSDLNSQVSYAADQQQTTSEDMNRRTNQINNQVTAASENFEDTAKRINELNDIAKQLDEAVCRIKW